MAYHMVGSWGNEYRLPHFNVRGPGYMNIHINHIGAL